VVKLKKKSCVIVFLVLCCTVAPVIAGSAAETSPALVAVINKMKSAYSLILETEEVGGDASAMVERLNVLLDDVTVLEAASEQDSEVMARLLRDVSSIEQDLGSLRQVAISRAELATRNLYLNSVAGVVIVLVLGFFSWRWFRSSYVQRMMKMRPEVVPIES